MVYGLVFPGQGSQAVGMGKELCEAFPVAREVFQEVDDTIRQNLSTLIFKGPQEALTLTENAQPALMAVSLAVMSVLLHDARLDLFSKVRYTAGHSLGEYTALAAVQVLNLSQTARLLKRRGQSMQKAVPEGEGGMIALLGAEMAQAQEIAQEAREDQVCAVANDNAPGQIILSGHRDALARATAVAQKFGLKRVIPLSVSAPFHCSLMAPAARMMEDALSQESFSSPRVPVISNVTAQPETVPETLKTLLVQQITHPVRWRESIVCLKSLGVTHIVEVGAGKVLSGLIKRIDPDIQTRSLEKPEDIDAFVHDFIQ